MPSPRLRPPEPLSHWQYNARVFYSRRGLGRSEREPHSVPCCPQAADHDRPERVESTRCSAILLKLAQRIAKKCKEAGAPWPREALSKAEGNSTAEVGRGSTQYTARF
jgi:hypothetical protein